MSVTASTRIVLVMTGRSVTGRKAVVASPGPSFCLAARRGAYANDQKKWQRSLLQQRGIEFAGKISAKIPLRNFLVSAKVPTELGSAGLLWCSQLALVGIPCRWPRVEARPTHASVSTRSYSASHRQFATFGLLLG